MKSVNQIALVISGLLLSAGSSLAASSGTITPGGTISESADITVATEPGVSSLSLAASGVDVLIATVNEKSNKKTGYAVTLASANGVADSVGTARFKGTGGTPETIDYTVKYNNATLTFAAGVATATASGTKTGGQGVDKTLQISWTGTFLAADTYSDTLTLTISNN